MVKVSYVNVAHCKIAYMYFETEEVLWIRTKSHQ